MARENMAATYFVSWMKNIECLQFTLSWMVDLYWNGHCVICILCERYIDTVQKTTKLINRMDI